MTDPIAAFARHLAHRSPRTVRSYVRILTAFASFTGVTDYSSRIPSVAEIEAFLARPRLDGGQRSPAGRNQELAAIKVFTAFAKRELAWPRDEVERIDEIEFAFVPDRDPVFLTAPELRQLFSVAGALPNHAQATMALALVALLSQAALRVSELARLDVAQVDLGGASLLSVLGKRGTVRHVPLNAPTVSLLRAWLEVRATIAPPAESALFVSRRTTRISVRSVQYLVTMLRRAMGTAKRLSPHPLRHTGATLMLTMGADISTVGTVLGHSDLNTTRRYVHLVDRRQRDAVDRMATTVPQEVLAVLSKPNGGQAARPDSAQFPGKNPIDVQQSFHEPDSLAA